MDRLQKAYDDMVALSHGGSFGIIKIGDFEKFFAFKYTEEPAMSEERIKLSFADLGQQMAIAWRLRNE